MNVLDSFCLKEIKRRGGSARKSHGNVFQSGWTDIVGCFRGRALFWETKYGLDELRPAQKLFMREMKKAGADVRLISVEQDVLDAFAELEKLLPSVEERKNNARRDRSSEP